MLRKISTGLILILAACSDSSGGTSGGKIDTADTACKAKTVAEFFTAIAGKVSRVAVDARAEAGLSPNPDDTFIDGNEYDVTFASNKKTTIETDAGNKSFTYTTGDTFDISKISGSVHEINIGMKRSGAVVLIQQECTGDKNLFLLYSSVAGAPIEFSWRLDVP